MLIFEYNPTHIETPDKSLELGEKRLETKPKDEDVKNDDSGGFARLLAGLINKKTHNEASQEASESEAFKEMALKEKSAEAGQKRKNLLFAGNSGKDEGLGKAELLKNVDAKKQRIIPEKTEDQSRFFMKGEKQVKQKSEKQNQTGNEETGFAAKPASGDFGKENDFVLELAGAKEPGNEKGKVRVERSLLNRETPEVSILDDIRATQLKKGEKPQQTDDTSETKKTGKKRERTVVQVRDLRTQTGQEAGQAIEQSVKGVEKTRPAQEREIIVDVRPSWERNEEPGTEAKPVRNGETFSQILARELNGGLSSDIVRQAVIVLRDGGEGTIKLALRPESLGKVKIQLEMSENKILGQIIVESEEALRAFEQEIHTLEQSFKDSGFEASLSAALDYRNDGQRWKENEARPFFSDRFAASYEETSSIFGENGEFDYGLSAVNMLA